MYVLLDEQNFCDAAVCAVLASVAAFSLAVTWACALSTSLTSEHAARPMMAMMAIAARRPELPRVPAASTAA